MGRLFLGLKMNNLYENTTIENAQWIFKTMGPLCAMGWLCSLPEFVAVNKMGEKYFEIVLTDITYHFSAVTGVLWVP